MAGWKDFREIAAWQHAQAVKLRMYALLERPRIKQDFEYAKQLRAAARSGPANIAEGFGRFGNKEFARFVRIAKGSEQELLNHLIDARDQRLLSDDELVLEEHHIRKALNSASGLIRHLERTANREPNPEQNPKPNREPATRNPEPKKSV